MRQNVCPLSLATGLAQELYAQNTLFPLPPCQPLSIAADVSSLHTNYTHTYTHQVLPCDIRVGFGIFAKILWLNTTLNSMWCVRLNWKQHLRCSSGKQRQLQEASPPPHQIPSLIGMTIMHEIDQNKKSFGCGISRRWVLGMNTWSTTYQCRSDKSHEALHHWQSPFGFWRGKFTQELFLLL